LGKTKKMGTQFTAFIHPRPVDFEEPKHKFSVKTWDGCYATLYADDETYDDLWKYCINNALKVVGIESN